VNFGIESEFRVYMANGKGSGRVWQKTGLWYAHVVVPIHFQTLGDPTYSVSCPEPPSKVESWRSVLPQSRKEILEVDPGLLYWVLGARDSLES
jgi:hypothetical protein